MAKTASERKAKQRSILKASGKYEEFRKKETQKQNLARKRRKESMTVEQKEDQRKKKREEMRRYREKRKLGVMNLNTPKRTPSKVFKSRSSYGKAIAKAKKNLPKSPNKRSAVVTQLFQDFATGTELSQQKHISNALSADVEETVLQFYNSDTVSYQAPGFRDYVIIRDSDGKKKIQKRYLTLTLGETYRYFKELYPNIKIGRSKFCEFRPKHVCLRCETPSNLCLCIHHENINLLLRVCPFLPNAINDFIRLLVCNETCEECMLQTCSRCGELAKFRNLIKSVCDSLSNESWNAEIPYQQWTSDETNKMDREKMIDTLEDVVQKLESKLPNFLQHVFVHQQQAQNFKLLKENIEDNTVLMQIDFSENYSFSYQDEVQSAHWSSNSCTLYTCMVYIKGASLPIVVVSDYLQHNKYAVAVFNDAIIDSVKKMYPSLTIKKVIYQSDGSAQHFKQKYSLCIGTVHFDQFQWHFSATSHGKGAIDGLGGSIKRRVREATMSRAIDPRTAKEFAACAKNICSNITVLYVSEEEINSRITQLDSIWAPNGSEIVNIPETRKMHFFEKISPYNMKVAYVSRNPRQYKTVNLISGRTEIVDHSDTVMKSNKTVTSKKHYSMGEWVLAPFHGKKTVKHFVGQIVHSSAFFVRVKFLRYDKDFEKFSWPQIDDIADVDINNITLKLPEPMFDQHLKYVFQNFNFKDYVMG